MQGYDKFARSHAYARRNGCKDSYDEYVTRQYRAYADACKRCGIKPMPRAEWFANA